MGILLDIVNIDMEGLVRKVINRAAFENRPQGDILKEELIKIAQNSTDQSMSNEHTKNINYSIADDEYIDNGQVYSEKTRETLRDLI
ncbi:MAG: hypothetical protein GX275_01720 [Clostridiales bacterium]|nr:hypothetical protein [Clostridiales bacterium]